MRIFPLVIACLLSVLVSKAFNLTAEQAFVTGMIIGMSSALFQEKWNNR